MQETLTGDRLTEVSGIFERMAGYHPADKRSVIHFVREDDESMKPPSNVKTPAQYIASLPADRAKTIVTVRALVNKHIPRGYDECLVWGTIGWTIPLSRYPDTYNKQPICYVALSSQKNYCSLWLCCNGIGLV